MKTLLQYIYETLNRSYSERINEWQLSNENTNVVEFDNYNCVKPKNEGTCLVVVVPCSLDERHNNITLYIYDYAYVKDDDSVLILNDPYKKNKEGYYYSHYNGNKYWRWVLLFNEDALSFLFTLLNNNKQKMNVFDICGSLLSATKNYEFICKDNNSENDFFSKSKIKSMIKQIK